MTDEQNERLQQAVGQYVKKYKDFRFRKLARKHSAMVLTGIRTMFGATCRNCQGITAGLLLSGKVTMSFLVNIRQAAIIGHTGACTTCGNARNGATSRICCQ